MLKKVIAFFFLLLFITGIAFTETTLYSGDDKIDEIQKRIDEEKARQKKEKEQNQEEDDGEESSCLSGLFEGCLEGLFNSDSYSDQRDTDQGSGGCEFSLLDFSLLEAFSYAPFPYAGDWGNDIVRCRNTGKANNKWGFLTASVAGSYLFENTKSLTTLLEANFFIIHMNGFYQYTMAESKSMNIFSINGGISIPLQSVLFNFFCGFFNYDYIGSPRFSFGVSTKIFLPANLYLDIYNTNSFFGSLGFHILNASLNLAFRRLSVGAGYRFHSYAGVIFQGPELKLSVWI
jgi:hypothetical protein